MTDIFYIFSTFFIGRFNMISTFLVANKKGVILIFMWPKNKLVATEMIQSMFILARFFFWTKRFLQKTNGFRWTVGQVSGNPRRLQISLKHAESSGVNFINMFMCSYYVRRSQKCKKLPEFTAFLRFWDLHA